MRKSAPFLALVAALLFGSSGAFAQITIVGPTAPNHVGSVKSGDDVSTLIPDPVTYLGGATAAMQGQLTAEFPTWTFNYAAGLAGTLNINEYKAVLPSDEFGGGRLDATYTRANTDPTIANLHWIQMIDTNRPLGGATTPYIDPRPNDDTLPFYWTLPEDGTVGLGNKTATTYHFFDQSTRDLSDDKPVTWRGELMLASWNGADPGVVTVYDGFRWGWNAQSTPEPGTVAMTLSFIVGGTVLVRRRRQRRQ